MGKDLCAQERVRCKKEEQQGIGWSTGDAGCHEWNQGQCMVKGRVTYSKDALSISARLSEDVKCSL